MKLPIFSRFIILIFALFITSCNKNNSDPEITDENLNEYFSVKSVANEEKAFKVIKGTATDGSILKIRILKLGNYDLKSVELSINTKNSGGLSLTPEAKPVAQLNDQNPVSKIYENIQYYEYYYHAPNLMPEIEGSNDSISTVKVNILINVNDKQFTLTRPIELIRTPIVMVHGLASDSNTFGPMINYISNSKQYLHKAIYSLDYAPTSIDSYATNDKVVENAIDVVRKRVYDSGYQVSKVNIAGHSMGGILTRLYLQSGRYRGDIQNFISIDTPHSGSQGADLLVELGEKHPGTILEIVGRLGAIVDLQVDSKATLEDLNGASLNKVKVPSAAITATFGGLKQVSQLVKEKQFLQAALVFILGNFTEKVYGEQNDIVVPLSSQKGGLKDRAIVSFDGEWHCSVHTTDQAAEKLVAMFNNTITRGFEFSTDGFAPKKLEYNSILNGVSVQNVAQNGTSKDTFVLPETVNSALIFAVNADNKIVDAQYFNGQALKYTGKTQDVKALKLIAHSDAEQKIVCSEIVLF